VKLRPDDLSDQQQRDLAVLLDPPHYIALRPIHFVGRFVVYWSLGRRVAPRTFALPRVSVWR